MLPSRVLPLFPFTSDVFSSVHLPVCTVQHCNEQPKVSSVSVFSSLQIRLARELETCRGSEDVFCVHPQFFVVLQLKSPLIIPCCQDFVTSDPSYAPFFHCGGTVLMYSALWVSFLAERQWESFSSSVLFTHFTEFIPAAIWLHVLPRPSCCSSHW